jgi:membrane-bound lytic murein transglycosylase A
MALALLLAACAQGPRPKPTAPPTAPPATPAPATPEPPPPPARGTDLPITAASLPDTMGADAALAAFRASCPALLKRTDLSGLTQPGDWAPACAAASTSDAAAFFRDQFRAVQLGDGLGLATGYFEPELAGSRAVAPDFAVPLYKRPPDLIEAELGDFAADLKGRKLRGRMQGNRLVPYFDRAAIMAGALAGKGLELAWAADPFEAFFLEIQGSGRLRLPDGSVMRVGYAGQNGQPYVAIGRLLVQRGALPKGGATMDTILAWLRANPAEAPALLAANPSQVFFREITGDGPIGSLNVPVRGGVSVAADPAFVPLGAPLWIDTQITATGQPLQALMVAQDTGGAIKGPNRVDLFRGAGATARAEAGAQAAKLRLLLLLPLAAADRLVANGPPPQRP